MIFININSTNNDILRQMILLADKEKDGILVCDRAGGMYSLSKVQSAGNLSSPTAEIEKMSEGMQPIYPEYQHQYSSEEFYDAGKANNYNIDKFVEETERLYPDTISAEADNKERTTPTDVTSTRTPEEQQEDKEAWDKLMKYIDDGMDPEEPISDEEWEEINRQYEEDMKLKEQEEQTSKKKRGRKKKENKDVF